MDSLAHVQAVTLPIVPPHPRPDAKNLGGEVSFEPPSHHSIISSARASSASGNERLSSFAVIRLMIISIFVEYGLRHRRSPYSTKIEIIINLITAKLLSLSFPLALLARADEMIE